jgi:hypothetical protein
VAVVRATNNKAGIHMHVVASEIKRDKALEENSPSREGRRKEDEEAGCGASVGHHVQDGAESGRLFEPSSGVAIEGIEEARYRVEEAACARMEWHVVERCDSEDDSRVA